MTDNKFGGCVIGLCGRSGAGKTTVCMAFEKLGIMPIDTDQVYRELTRPDDGGMPSELVRLIAHEFGEDVIASDGSLDRAVLARSVFGDGNGEKLRLLNSITHKYILARTEEMILGYMTDGAKGVIVDAPALFESGFDKKCDVIVCVSAPDDVLAERIMVRDSISEEAARQRLSSQISDAELRLRSDYVIENGDGADPTSAATAVAEKILNR